MNRRITVNMLRSISMGVIKVNFSGLGDRHCENIQICQRTGEVVHIDLNMIFNKGRSLKVKGLQIAFASALLLV